ncbi:DNA-directed RNA polymerase subunit K [archaeon]|jgi:DNA-directed RNA polymerase subunit K/omega|nr:DNA-directed RNA polymerase subunit K [archaeon]MBT3578337.1 DNA-directed RNA polymerase subunit K [archaeon]MBT6820122.1 DNA-directed RNA polymerase subunit K [archaeon]MBT6956354.1 DNA-directed RNA polymerase subunit K [archaeon]MBT7025473.1 DNA-directed RNA polymerase subunit K [archaeon]
MAEENKQEFSKYERARIIGARGLQISMDAPILVKIDDEALGNLNYDPLKIAELELESGILPISINKPMPERHEEDIEKVKIETKTLSDAEKIKAEQEEEKEIAEGGEMMGLANPEEEREDTGSAPRESAVIPEDLA